jgi:hypothetical protein
MEKLKRLMNQLKRILYGVEIKGEVIEVKKDVILEKTYSLPLVAGWDIKVYEHRCLEREIDVLLHEETQGLIDTKLVYTYCFPTLTPSTKDIEMGRKKLQEIKIVPGTRISGRVYGEKLPYVIRNKIARN